VVVVTNPSPSSPTPLYQCGTTWAGAPVGFLAHHYGWGAIYHLFMTVTLMAGVFFLIPALQVENNIDVLTPVSEGWRRVVGGGKKKKEEEEEEKKKATTTKERKKKES